MTLSSRGTRSRRAAFLTSVVLRDCEIGSGAGSIVGSGVGANGAGLASGTGGTGAGASGAGPASGTGGTGAVLNSGMFIDSSGAMGSGPFSTVATLGSGSGKGPTASPSSPVSSSGTEEGAATGSENTGSTFVVLVISSIAFCKSLSAAGAAGA